MPKLFHHDVKEHNTLLPRSIINLLELIRLFLVHLTFGCSMQLSRSIPLLLFLKQTLYLLVQVSANGGQISNIRSLSRARTFTFGQGQELNKTLDNTWRILSLGFGEICLDISVSQHSGAGTERKIQWFSNGYSIAISDHIKAVLLFAFSIIFSLI